MLSPEAGLGSGPGLRMSHYSIEQALLTPLHPHTEQVISKDDTFKCLSSIKDAHQEGGRTLSSVAISSVECSDPLLSNLFQEACDGPSGQDALIAVPLPLQDALDITTSYSVFNTQYNIESSQYHLGGNGSELAAVGVPVPISFEIREEEDGLVTDPPAGEEGRRAVLARTWTEELAELRATARLADTEIVCAGGLTVAAHKLVLAAASPFLAQCLVQLDTEERSSLVLPDFSLGEVEEFLDLIYLRSQIITSGSLLQFLNQSFVTEEIEEESVKCEDKVKKLPVEVKMEDGQGQDNIENIQNKDDKDEESTKKSRNPHTCNTCGKTFKLGRILKEHMNLHNDPLYSCEYSECKRKFHLKANLKAHIDVVHLKKKKIPCLVCGKFFYNQSTLRSHMEHHNTDRHVCEHCSSCFSSSKSLKDHIKFKHSNPDFLPKCTICHKTYSTPQNLKSHFSRVHMQEKKHVCSNCGKAFFEKSELDFHISSHNPIDRNIECDVCKLFFKNKKTLYYHKQRTHDPKKKIHICYQCGKSYSDSHYLNRHLESHGQKSSYCKTCGKAFQSDEKVKAHQRKVHEKWRKSEEYDKPCILCVKKFLNFGSMKRHLKDVHKLSTSDANALLVEKYQLDPKKHRMKEFI